MELKLTKKYSTKTIRAVLIMFMEMLDSIPIDYDFFYEYTGLSTTTYSSVRKIITEMIIDLKLNDTYEVVKTERNDRYTRYFTYSYKLNVPDPIDYSYHLSDDLDDNKRINYSMTIIYLMLKNKEKVTLRTLSKIFPGYEKYRNLKLMNHLKDIVDGDLIIKKRKYILEDWDYE